MTQELVFLFIGYAVIWVLLFGYLVFVTGRIRSVRDAVHDMRRELDAQRREASE
ncbi:MAG: CcmD family protein [Chloroflexi bacterium]|nr:CcmD family protein [Chloroflexota bacterium]